jgi:hypothetical protein
MPVTIGELFKRPDDDLSKVSQTPPPDANIENYRFSGIKPIRDYDDNIIGTVFTRSRTERKLTGPMRTRNLDFRR